ncbi:hypothetical protein A2U01_0050179, partial [Trifolium medium]|nr:hypothetical protein [Trifolium medium]
CGVSLFYGPRAFDVMFLPCSPGLPNSGIRVWSGLVGEWEWILVLNQL